ncbi:MAG: HD domain-containing protein [Ignavibacteriae bacterium]|nr:HD domain-containing protein [Ignavibacteriota bacterium]
MTRAKRSIEITQDKLLHIGSIADALGLEAYVVGGYVRDKLLGKEVKDIDIVVIGDGVAFAKHVATRLGFSQVVTYDRFGTAMLPLDDGNIEFVTAREEHYEPASRKPKVKKASLESDLSRRDFTINTIAASINKEHLGEIIDPFGGEKDMKVKIIRTPLEPEKTFDDDPLRMMRAIRFSSQLQFHIERDTLEGIRHKADRITIVSKERIADEFIKILVSPKPSIGLKLLYDTSLANHVFPELVEMVGVEQRKDYHHKDVFLHTLKVVDNIAEATENVWLRFAALVHDIGKPRTKAFKEDVGWTFHGHEEVGARMIKPIFQRMRLTMDKLPYVEKLVRLHLRPMVLVSEEVKDSAIRRLLFEASNEIDDLMALCRADITSQNPQRVARYLKNYDIVLQKMKEVEEKDRLRNWQPPVRGDEIMRVCDLEPGPLVGILKKKIEEAILEGTIPNEHDAALEYLLSIKDTLLSK